MKILEEFREKFVQNLKKYRKKFQKILAKFKYILAVIQAKLTKILKRICGNMKIKSLIYNFKKI